MEEAGEKHEVHLIAVHHSEPVEAEANAQAEAQRIQLILSKACSTLTS